MTRLTKHIRERMAKILLTYRFTERGNALCNQSAALFDLVAARNRRDLWQLGRLAPRKKGPRFDFAAIPDHRLDALIQRHANLDLVERLRAERARRFANGGSQ